MSLLLVNACLLRLGSDVASMEQFGVNEGNDVCTKDASGEATCDECVVEGVTFDV